MLDPRRAAVEHLRFLHEIGVESLRVERPPSASMQTAPPGRETASGPVPTADGGSAPAIALAAVRSDLGDCTRCRLSRSRTQIVFGVGNPSARLMFVGEAPGRDEDLKGEPFVGRAGQLLDRMIESIGLRRGDVYIANVVKCRPPDNRNPQEDEIDACSGFLWRQVEAIAPRVIVALGKFAAGTLLGEEIAITKCRGRLRTAHGVAIMPTYHPAYLLRQYTAENRRAVYDDLLQVKALLEGPPADP
jgi:uracil-DNA glycosylase